MEKLIEVIEINIVSGPVVGWLEKVVISENGTVIAERLERKNFLINSGPIPQNTPALVIEVIEALADLDWPIPAINPMP